MISKHDFQTMLKSPEHLLALPVEELENLVRHYPWFSLGQTLLAKAYKEQNTYKFSDQLSLASTLSSNRNWLYTYLKTEAVQAPAAVVEEAVLQEIEEVTVEIPQQEVLPTEPAVSTEPNRFESLHSLAEKMVADEEFSVTVKERETEVETETETETESENVRTATEGMDLLDKSILAAAVSSSIYLEVGEEEEEVEEISKPSAPISNPISSEELSSDPFIQWLQAGDSAPSTAEPEPKINSTEVQQAQSLIDRFIASEPKITPGKAEQYTGVSFAQNSLDDSFEWVTETMAKLYAVQGKIDRARKAYKRLIELHPEKKIYFEQQLKALNQRK